jgi:hypothetical protein
MPKKARVESCGPAVVQLPVARTRASFLVAAVLPFAPGEQAQRGAAAERRPPGREPQGQQGWADVGKRSKAGFEARARAGAMLRLTRVMKNR